jgi:hypothetical protein
MMNRKIALLSLATIALVVSAPAMAGRNAQGQRNTASSDDNNNNNFAKKHPRRAQVLKRDKKLENRTENAEKNGKITDAQAKHLEGEEAAIHKQEQADAAANGGKITKSEQRDLNREENRVNRELKRDERRDARRKNQGQGGQQQGGGNAPAAGGNAPAAGGNAPAGGTTPPAGGQ